MAETKNQHTESDSISQDDIDQLLQSAISQETEGKEEIDNLLRNLSLEERATDQNDTEENNNLIDEISPGDIRDLLNISLDDISVDELEAELLQAQNQIDSDEKAEAEPQPATKSDDAGAISQDDIDKLLVGELTADSTKAEAESKPAAESDSAGAISQGDIDKLLAGELTADSTKAEAESKPAAESDGAGAISQDDIDKLLAGETDTDEQPQEEERSLFISQNELNLLLEEYNNKPSNSNVETEKKAAASLLEESGIENPQNFVSQNELDMLLSEASDNKSKDSEEGLISQEDIDNLLQGKDDIPEEEEADTSSLISQHDIDTLLKGADDDSLEELHESGLVSQEDIDSLLRNEVDQDDEQNPTEPQIELDRVVLEEADDSKIISDEPPPPEVQKIERKKWYRSRLVIACSAGAIVFLISFVSLYFFLSSDHAGTGKPEIASIESEQKNMDPTVKETILSGLSIDFNGFVILDPHNRDNIAYLTADVQINCNSNTIVNAIASRKPFFRFLIYDIFQKTLEKLELPEKGKNSPSEKQDSSQSENQDVSLIDKTKLQIMIRQSLENALSEKGIKEIVLKNIDLF